MMFPMVRQRETLDDNPELLKEEWNKLTNFLEDNTDVYEITSIYHEARKRVSAKYKLYYLTDPNLKYLHKLCKITLWRQFVSFNIGVALFFVEIKGSGPYIASSFNLA